ncbi:MAG TPA: DNA ligase D [Desulfitobacteriaceae bacterium]|nr:DNA ligase D [Desulfitobacteriaceae bacterium]
MKKIRDPLSAYKKKRDFSITPEPQDGDSKKTSPLSFVVQKHAARNIHYDFRLEVDGVLKSWAIPKGPSFDPKQKRLAVRVEDHPLSYLEFEGVIPPQQYGAGKVIVWDRGTWEPTGDPLEELDAGHLKFKLHGEKLKGAWALVRMHDKSGKKQEPWLLIKESDAYARAETEFNVVVSLPDSVLNDTVPDIPSGAQPGPVPSAFSPQLATLVDSIPANGDWNYEIKFDGYRILARIDKNNVELFTRNGQNWTAKLESLASALGKLNIAPGWLDGEIVMLGADGIPDFSALQQALESAQTNQIRYYVFDIPFCAGFDLRNVALTERRGLLAKVLDESVSSQIRFSEDFAASGSEILHKACLLGLEGVIGKRKDSPYAAGRSRNWIKVKCLKRQEFVLVGYTESKGQSGGVGALLLGVYDDAGRLHYVGRVGTGFDQKTASLLEEKLSLLKGEEIPISEKPRNLKGIWVKPELVAEVSFAEWTRAGRVRQAVFHGLRSDKPPTLIKREIASGIVSTQKDGHSRYSMQKKSPMPESVGSPISNPDRIIDSSTGLKKADLFTYYQLASKWLLPQLEHRPVSFLRAPSGINGQIFFQKHGDTLKISGLKQLDLAFDPEHPALLEIDSHAALIGAVQMNVMEFHTWNATTKNIEKPDRMVFDLDPGEKIEWPVILEAADLIHTFLEEIGLQSFLKTSGGNGLHIVVPLSPRDDWETVMDFSKAVAQHLADVIPSLFVAISGSRHRMGKVFVDYNRNSRGATTVAAYSARARPGMGVSMPCTWDELAGLTGGAHWTITNTHKRLESSENPWENYLKTKQILRAAIKKIFLPR